MSIRVDPAAARHALAVVVAVRGCETPHQLAELGEFVATTDCHINAVALIAMAQVVAGYTSQAELIERGLALAGEEGLTSL